MTGIEWDRREVCPDGACIGVIGDDGLCKVCGRAAPNWGNERTRGLVDPSDEVDAAAADDDEADDDDDDDLDDAADSDGAEPGDDWDNRELCSNGACVGVIGDDGICSVCGSPRA
ncbi:MAG TPA: hypothetical protein VGL61_18975 [Kofleriaceae bacterium]|jgi:hypothetical protein